MKKLSYAIGMCAFLIVAVLAASSCADKVKKKTFTVNGVSFNMVLVEAGSYDGPNGKVTISRDYYIGETLVTQALYKAVTGTNPSFHQGNDLYPVEQVGWDEFQPFLKKLNEMTGEHFRMPFEVEYDYASLGGKYSKGYYYPGSDNPDKVAWTKENSAVDGVTQSHEVATKEPNELGLYDMFGNLWEWCEEWYQSSYPSGTDPFYPVTSEYSKLTKSINWDYTVDRGPVKFNRWYFYHGYKYGGFRLALTADPAADRTGVPAASSSAPASPSSDSSSSAPASPSSDSSSSAPASTSSDSSSAPSSDSSAE